MRKVKVIVVPLVIGALRAVTPKLGLQQIPRTTSWMFSFQKSAVLGTCKILSGILRHPDLWSRT